MKKILSLLLLGAAAVGFVGCGDDDPAPAAGAPTLTLSSNTAQDIPGATVTVTATITAPGGAKTLSVAGGSTQTITLGGGTTAETEDVDIVIPANAVVGSTIAVVFTAFDNSNQASTPATLTITVGNPVIQLTGNIAANQTLDASKSYLLKGQVFVKNGITLTIPAGTVIKGDKATKATLIVEPGGKLVASGTSTNPVVFTSAQAVGARDRGDWGGVIILGNAWVNQATQPSIEGITPSVLYGNLTSPATNADENSGSLTYVRIEYAGIELTPNNETNSLTMGGVGSGTTIDNVQASYGGDDGFEWFGGSVNAKHLVSFSTWDDDFDTDFGYGGKVQFALAVRNTFFADQSGSNAFESDNQGNANDTPGGAAGYTRAVFSNVTVLGPRDINSRPISGSFQNAMHIRRRSSLSIFNSFFSGFRTGLRVDDDATYANIVAGTLKLSNNVLTIPANSGTGSSATAADALFITGIKFTAANDGTIDNAQATNGNAVPIANFWNASNKTVNNITAITTLGDLGLATANYWGLQNSGNYPSNPNFALVAGVAGESNLNSGASFSDEKLDDFFTGTEYRGAFGATDWTDGWAEFQPINKAY